MDHWQRHGSPGRVSTSWPKVSPGTVAIGSIAAAIHAMKHLGFKYVDANSSAV